MSVRPNRPMLLPGSDGACAAGWKERETHLVSRRALPARGIRAADGHELGRRSRPGRHQHDRRGHDDSMRGPKLMWPVHEWDGWHGTSPMKNLYVGTAGVLWAL